jgi:hypothetical protein
MQEWLRILEIENWRVRSLLLVPLGLKSILNYKPVLVVGSTIFVTFDTGLPYSVFNYNIYCSVFDCRV